MASSSDVDNISKCRNDIRTNFCQVIKQSFSEVSPEQLLVAQSNDSNAYFCQQQHLIDQEEISTLLQTAKPVSGLEKKFSIYFDEETEKSLFINDKNLIFY